MKKTPETTIIKYVCWHVEAYGAPAPLDELEELVKSRHPRLKRTVQHILDSLCEIDVVKWAEQRYISSGYVPGPMAQRAPTRTSA